MTFAGVDDSLVAAHLTPAALAKAKALGVVAAALTAGGAGGMVALSTVSSSSGSTGVVVAADATSTPTTEPTGTPTEAPTPTVSPAATDAAATPAGAFTLPSCPAGVKNHGAYVSGVAHDAPKGRDGHHGSWVSQAAKSDCGKPAAASESPQPEHTDAPETHSPKPAKTTQHKSASSDAHHGGRGGH